MWIRPDAIQPALRSWASAAAIAAALALQASATRAEDGFQVNDIVDGDQKYPAVAVLPDGGYLVAWPSAPGRIQARRFHPSGVGDPEVTVTGALEPSGTYWE